MRNKNKLIKSKNFTYSFSDFFRGVNAGLDDGKVPVTYAKESYNFDFTKGALKKSLGFHEGLMELFDEEYVASAQAELDAIGDIIRVYVFKRYDPVIGERGDKLLLLSSDYSLFILDLAGHNQNFSRVRNVTFTSIPNAVNFRLNGDDVLVLASPTDNMVIYDGVNMPYEVLDAPKVSSMDIHYERLFVTTVDEKARVLFSDDLDITNWSLSLEEAGFIEMVDERGALNRVVSFNDYLYIFRDYGISRLTAFGDQEGFSVSHLFSLGAKIYPESVAVSGDRIIFLSNNGLYSFDGYNCTKILSNLDGLIASNNDNSKAAYFMGKYYLSLNMNFDENNLFDESGFVTNALIEYEPTTKKYKIVRGVSVVSITPVTSGGIEKLYISARGSESESYKVYVLDESGKFDEQILPKKWKSDKCNFSSIKQKVLRAIVIDGEAGACIKITNQYGESKSIVTNSGQNRYMIFLSGVAFEFEISSTQENAKINLINLEFSVLGGVWWITVNRHI